MTPAMSLFWSERPDFHTVHEYIVRCRDNVRYRLSDFIRREHPRVVAIARKSRRHRAGIDRRDFHALMSHLEHQAFGEPSDGVLARRVRRAADERASPGDRSDD